MTESEKVACVQEGLSHKPTEEEIREWLYGASKVYLTEKEQAARLEPLLRGSPDDWRRKVFQLICQIPAGRLISYRDLAIWANREFGLTINARNTAWLRKRIYQTIGHDTEIPLHRIANAGDTKSSQDHPVTRVFNRKKRLAEGSLHNPDWMHFSSSASIPIKSRFSSQ